MGPGVLQSVKTLMEAGAVKVEHNLKLKGSAEYDMNTNTLNVWFTEATDIPKKALIVHEATHAAYDLAKIKMSVAESESIAYIAQCCYARANAADPNDRLKAKTPEIDKVFEVAWGIAAKIQNGSNPDFKDCSNMRDAVSEHPFYSAKYANSAGFNG